MSRTKPLIAVGYERVSSEKQVENNSLDTQRDIINAYANSNGWQVIRHFREEGYSGRNTNRPMYNDMKEYIIKNHVDVVLVHLLDRLHRNELNLFKDIKFFRDRKIKLIAIAEGIDSDDEMSSLIIAVKAALSADFSRNLSKRTHMGLKAGAESCKHMGGIPPYGYKVNKDTKLLEIDDITAPAVQMMFELYAEGFPTREICEWLEQHGFRTAKGKFFKPNALNTIFNNEKYRGCFTWDKAVPKDDEGHKNSHKSKSEYLKIEGGCPALVSTELFEKVQARLKENAQKASHSKAKRYYPFNGCIYCECGERMTGNVQHSGDKRYYQYRCSCGCGNKSIRAEYLEKSVLDTVSECLFSSTNTEQLIKILNRTSVDHKLDADAEYQQLTSKKSGLETSQNNLLDAIGAGKATTAILNRLDRTSAELEQIEARISNLDRETHSFTEDNLSSLKARFSDYMMTHGDVNSKRLLGSIIQRIDVTANEVQITFSDCISIDSQTKKILLKRSVPKMETNKNISNVKKYDAILIGIKEKNEKQMSMKLAVRPEYSYSYSGNCDLVVSYDSFFNLLANNEVLLEDACGSKMNLVVEMNGDKIGKILSVDF